MPDQQIHDTRPAQEREGTPLLIVSLAVILLAAASLLPWGELSGGLLKDFNLFEDISVAAADEEPQQAEEAPQQAAAAKATERRDGPAEDYTPGAEGLRHLRQALTESDRRTVRIGFIGDSYIEGDILTQDLRETLQERWGGCGVGYVTPHSIVSGFRTTINQSDRGWTGRDLRTSQSADCCWLSGQSFTGAPGASVTWRAASRPLHATAWHSATILYKCTDGGELTTDIGNGPLVHIARASGDVQAITLSGTMSRLTLTNKSARGLTVYGAWLDGGSGITVDCMSLRGNSGMTHSLVSADLARAMAPWIDYDMIIVEYGLNALSDKQKDYTAYGRRMERTLAALKKAYPNADILMMGAGDRGQKSGGTVRSAANLTNMIDAQRTAAQHAGVLFFDTRKAMGGADAIGSWRARKLVNADYTHLNASGGAEMARLLDEAIVKAL